MFFLNLFVCILVVVCGLFLFSFVVYVDSFCGDVYVLQQVVVVMLYLVVIVVGLEILVNGGNVFDVVVVIVVVLVVVEFYGLGFGGGGFFFLCQVGVQLIYCFFDVCECVLKVVYVDMYWCNGKVDFRLFVDGLLVVVIFGLLVVLVELSSCYGCKFLVDNLVLVICLVVDGVFVDWIYCDCVVMCLEVMCKDLEIVWIFFDKGGIFDEWNLFC